jgi:hypothetical protein
MTLNGESLIPLALSLFFLYLARGGDWKESARPAHMKSDHRWTLLWYSIAAFLLLAGLTNLLNLQ